MKASTTIGIMGHAHILGTQRVVSTSYGTACRGTITNDTLSIATMTDDDAMHHLDEYTIHNSTALIVSLTHAKQRRSTRARGRLLNHLYDWMAHQSNLAKGTEEGNLSSNAKCPLCGTPATQPHINAVCSHPALLDQRIVLKRDIDLHFLCLRHTVLPPAQR
jgi:hypothetical protein